MPYRSEQKRTEAGYCVIRSMPYPPRSMPYRTLDTASRFARAFTRLAGVQASPRAAFTPAHHLSRAAPDTRCLFGPRMATRQ